MRNRGELSDPETIRALQRRSLSHFAAACFRELNRGTSLEPNWHHLLIASKLEACLRGECRRLIINLPPRHLKSLFASVALPAYGLGLDPSVEIVSVSYAQELAEAISRDCRQVMGSHWYRKLFPKTRISAQRDSVGEFMTTAGGSRIATSVGGTLTGRGGDVIILDDPLKPSEAISDIQRAKVNDWFGRTLYSRLNHQKSGVIILVMQRLHQDDLVGHVLEQEDWEVVSLPAIAEEEERHVFFSLGKEMQKIRRAGELLQPGRQDIEALARIRATIGEYDFSAQYQQAPVPLGGAMVKEAWLQTYDQAPEKFELIIQSWDTANKDTELSDYSVCTTWGLLKGRMFLLHVLRRRLNYPDLKRAVQAQATQHGAKAILIEDRASGTQLIQDLQRDGLNMIHPQNPEGDKAMRLHVQTCWFEGGNVLLPKAAAWLADYRKELLSFPKAKHDDQVDSTTQALAWAARPRNSGGIYIVNSPEREQFHRHLEEYVGRHPGPGLRGLGYW